ncbi:hypothetical protein [Actinoplanes sp. TFC3]|uniref:hypothetical protein n=1 Tax=Actinoplanes sp. TFC3 TaxID=1710355 RepID=UPI00082E53B4|nr:hypothetical protein [Actinoplanes sp. TFC3]
MTARFTHGRSIRHRGALCGVDEGPGTRVTDEAHLVTCPDCPDAADLETVPDDATTGDSHVIAMLCLTDLAAWFWPLTRDFTKITCSRRRRIAGRARVACVRDRGRYAGRRGVVPA